MPAAARVSDLHTCPKTPAGPILQGASTVLICGMPAARISDMVTCTEPEFIVTGEKTVLIEGKPAARMGDMTEKACPSAGSGVITTGCPTVLIGSTYQETVLKVAAENGAPFCDPVDAGQTEEETCPPGEDCKKLRNVDRKGTEAFKRDEKGKIKSTKTGRPYRTGHVGAPGYIFVAEDCELELQDGSKIQASKSLGKLDSSGNLVPDHRMDTDCHGVTFTNGEYWIDNDKVDRILTGGGFQETTTPKPGDIGVYRDANSNIVHSVTVEAVDKTGKVTKVTGLGGIQMEEHIDTPEEGWKDPKAKIHYYTK